MDSMKKCTRLVDSTGHRVFFLRQHVLIAAFLCFVSFHPGRNASGESIHAALTSPPNGSAWAAGSTIPLAADAWTTEGTIIPVELHADGSIIHTAISTPY